MGCYRTRWRGQTGDDMSDDKLTNNATYFLQHVRDEIDLWHRRPEDSLDGDDATQARLRGLANALLALVDNAPAMDIDIVDACYELRELHDLDTLITHGPNSAGDD